MNVRTRGYEGLLEHQEVLEGLCGAVLLQAVKDRAALVQRGHIRKTGSTTNLDALDKWFKSRTCREMCNVLGVSLDFSKIDWENLQITKRKKVCSHGS